MDIREAVPGLLALAGSPAAGEVALRRALVDYLTGREPLESTFPSSYLRFRDLAAIPALCENPLRPTWAADQYGVLSLELTRSDQLASRLEALGVDYLLFLGGLKLQPAYEGGPEHFGSPVSTGFGFTLIGQVVIWDRDSERVALRAFVGGRAQHDTATLDDVARWFANDLHDLLR